MTKRITPARRYASVLMLSASLVGTALLPTTGAMAGTADGDRPAAASRLQANLKASGDPDGSGEANFRLLRAKHKICATVEWRKIQDPDSAHIHKVSDGTVVVDLSGSVTGGANCATVGARKIKRINNHPRRYYFNVHNATYPAGAIQGVLHR